MGCFDSVFFPCPNCNASVEFQSKGGPCGLLEYDGRKKVPADVAGGVGSQTSKCPGCGKLYVAKAKKVRMRMEEAHKI